ncbi:MAG: hypothetical protein ACRDUW_02190 [Pseudonocardiaceae bacterium]
MSSCRSMIHLAHDPVGTPTAGWHLLADPEPRYHDLGSGFYQSKINARRRERDLIHQLEHLTGKKVTLAPRPAQPAA